MLTVHDLTYPPMQLSYMHRLFDVEGALYALPDDATRATAEERLAPLRPTLDAAAKCVATFRDASAYRWVSLGDMFGTLTAA